MCVFLLCVRILFQFSRFGRAFGTATDWRWERHSHTTNAKYYIYMSIAPNCSIDTISHTRTHRHTNTSTFSQKTFHPLWMLRVRMNDERDESSVVVNWYTQTTQRVHWNTQSRRVLRSFIDILFWIRRFRKCKGSVCNIYYIIMVNFY